MKVKKLDSLKSFLTAAMCLSRDVSFLPSVSFPWPKTHVCVCVCIHLQTTTGETTTVRTVQSMFSAAWAQFYATKKCFHNFKSLTSAEICQVCWFNQTDICIHSDLSPVRAETFVTGPHVLNLNKKKKSPRTLTFCNKQLAWTFMNYLSRCERTRGPVTQQRWLT